MRVIVAVLLFVSAAHAAIWGVLQEKQPAPDFSGILPSVSYAPFERAHIVADEAADSEKIRTDLKKLATMTRAIRLYTSTEGSELVPPVAAEFGLKVTLGVWIDSNADRTDREIKAAINLARKNSNVIGIVIGNETIFRAEQIPIENLWVLPLTDPADAERIRQEQREQMDSAEVEREVARIVNEESQRVRDASAQPEDKRAEALKWAIAENNVYRLIRVIQRVKKYVNVPVTTGEIWGI